MTASSAPPALVMELPAGRVRIALAPSLAPLHVERVVALARAGDYDGVAFHRVLPGFVAQAGDVEFGDLDDGYDPDRVGTGGSSLPDLPLESPRTLFERGFVGMARGPAFDSANSQFFIALDELRFREPYAAFGLVTSGMQAVDRLKAGAAATDGAVPGTPDRILMLNLAEDAGVRREGGAGADALRGGARDDVLLGAGGGDALTALGGDDWLDGGAGRDRLSAGAGSDTVAGGLGDDGLDGGAGADRLDGGGGRDTVDGGAGADTIAGGSFADLLRGGAGADRVDGGAGADVIAGGAGDDLLDGGSGADRFVFSGDDFGRDRVTGFRPDIDRIDLRGSDAAALSDLAFRTTAAGLEIRDADGSSRILLAGVADDDAADWILI